jgi:asparagine synthase (glutamine-hydrolysing)
MRLRADVPVGAYLSGGLDSSITASLARSASPHPLQSFSITFAGSEFDESLHQEQVASEVGSVHNPSVIGVDTIAQSFPNVLWHTETPLLRIAPALMYHLAQRTKESGVKVVVGGDGADEVFLGNDVFKEMSVRAIADVGQANDPLFSHLPRFFNSRIDDCYTEEFRASLGGIDVVGELRASLPTRLFGWSPLNQAAYLEMTTRLSPYLLSSYGDRMTMAHGVEGRYPFLDHRVFEFAAALPTGSRLRGLRDKEILRRWASRILPGPVNSERKPSYRAPDAESFFLPASPSWVEDHLTGEALRRVGIFSPAAVSGLVRRCQAGLSPALGENQTIIGVLSTQLWYYQFIENAHRIPALPLSGASVLLGDSAQVQPANTLYAPKPY